MTEILIVCNMPGYVEAILIDVYQFSVLPILLNTYNVIGFCWRTQFLLYSWERKKGKFNRALSFKQ